MSCSDSDRQRIDSRGLEKSRCVFSARVETRQVVCFGLIVMSDVAELALDRHAVSVREVHHTPRLNTVFVERKFGAIEHDRSVASLDAARG